MQVLCCKLCKICTKNSLNVWNIKSKVSRKKTKGAENNFSNDHVVKVKWSRGQQQTASTFPQGLRAWEVRWQKAGFPSLPTPFCQRQPQSPTSLSWSPITHRKWKLSASRAVPNRSPRAVRYGMEKLSGSLPLRHMECTIQSDIHNNSNTWRRKKRLDHHILIIKDTARSLHNSLQR